LTQMAHPGSGMSQDRPDPAQSTLNSQYVSQVHQSRRHTSRTVPAQRPSFSWHSWAG